MMRFLHNMNMGTKIMGLVMVLLLLMGTVAGFGIVKMGHICEEITEIAEEDLPMIEILTDIANAQMEQAIWFERALRYGEVLAAKEQAKDRLLTAEKEFERLAQFADEKLLEGEQFAEEAIQKVAHADVRQEFQGILERLKAIDQEHHEYEDHVLQVFALINQGNAHEAEALAEQIEQEEDELDHELDQFLRTVEQFTEASALKAKHDEEAAIKGMVIITALALVIGIAFGIVITLGVLRQLGAEPSIVAAIAQRVADGDLTVQFDMYGKMPRGVLAAMKNMVEHLNEIATGVKGAAHQVASGSQELSASSEQMSQGTSEQASTAEEVSSTMEEMAANIRQNAENARMAEQIAVQAAVQAQEVKETAAESATACQRIVSTIALVEDIARQTRMLSLNATIEAARAQEHGKGFAVVAAEVRALAERSRQAAQEIAEVSQNNFTITEQAGKKLMQLVPTIQKTAELVQEISAASQEQSAGTQQVNRAIQQLDQVIQEQAATSEETAATAEELSAQAEMLQSAIMFFKTEEHDDVRQLMPGVQQPMPERRPEPEHAANDEIVRSRFLTNAIAQNAEEPGSAVETLRQVEALQQIKLLAQTGGNGNGNGNGHGYSNSNGNGHHHGNGMLEDDLDAEFERF